MRDLFLLTKHVKTHATRIVEPHTTQIILHVVAAVAATAAATAAAAVTLMTPRKLAVRQVSTFQTQILEIVLQL
jgi:hypothetical protein